MATATAAQVTQIANLYISLFNRAPDTAGLSFWSSALANGSSITTITQGFLNAPEGVTQYPSFLSASDFVTSFYTKVFGRSPDAGGLAFWSAALTNAGGVESAAAKASVVAGIVSVVSTPLTARPAGLTDAQYAQTVNDRALFANKVEVGTYLASNTPLTVANAATALNNVSADPASVAAVKGAANIYANALVTALSNTGSAVLGSSSGDAFSLSSTQAATADTLAGFSLDGAAGVDTLTITGTGVTFTDTLKNFSNIEVINFATTTGSTVAAAKFVGATTFGSTGTGTLAVTGLAAGQGVAVNATGAGTTSATYLAAATAAKVGISGGTSGAITLVGTGLTSAAISSTGAVANVANITLADTIGTVAIDAATNLTTTLTSAKATASSLTVAGGGAVNLGTVPNTFTTINASGSTGGLTATLNNTLALTGSSGVDKIALTGNVSSTAVFTLGDGADVLTGTAVIAAGASIDGGAGIDAVSSSLISTTNGAVFKNFEILQLDGSNIVDAASLTGSTLTGLTLNSGGGSVNNVASTVGLTVVGAAAGITTIGVTGAAANTADVYTITLANTTAAAAATAGTIGLANVETINLVSAGTASATTFNTIKVADLALKTLNITGSKALDVSFTATSATSLIDGSAATGSLAIDTTNVTGATVANGGLTVKGGTAADTLTIAQAATVSSGAGADKIVITSAINNTYTGAGVTDAIKAAAIAASVVTITDFAKTDSITFTGVNAAPALISFTDASAALTLAAAAENVVGGNSGAISAFRFAGDTYLVADLGTAGTFSTGDILVKLSGVVDTAQFTHAVNSNLVVFA